MTFRLESVSIAVLVSCAAIGCDTPTRPTGGSAASSGDAGGAAQTAYAATLSASPTCGGTLPAEVRVQQFVATLHDDGRVSWSSPAVSQPPGHVQVSSASWDGDVFRLVIGTKEDPQSDAFHGIMEALAGGEVNIAGSGNGRASGLEIVGTFDGVFSYYPPSSAAGAGAIYCSAADHSFRLVPTSTSPAAISGMVVDAATSSPIAEARVEWAGLAEAWGDEGHGVLTDASGRYSMTVGRLGGPGAAEGLIVMRASKPGYADQSQQVKLTLGRATTVNFELRR